MYKEIETNIFWSIAIPSEATQTLRIGKGVSEGKHPYTSPNEWCETAKPYGGFQSLLSAQEG